MFKENNIEEKLKGEQKNNYYSSIRSFVCFFESAINLSLLLFIPCSVHGVM